MPYQVSRQRTATWRSRWAGEADVARAMGESGREVAKRLGRAKG